MARTSNLQKAHQKICELSSSYEGVLTMEVFLNIFNEAVSEFNLDEAKVEELKTMQYPRQIEDDNSGESEGDNKTDKEELEQPEELDEIELLQTQIESLKHQVDTLTCALEKVASLSGWGNHLKEFNLKMWKPTKKDMGKNYSS